MARTYKRRKAHKPAFYVDMYQLAVSSNVKGASTTMSYRFEEALERKLKAMQFKPVEIKQVIELKHSHRKNKQNKAVTLPPAFIASLEVPLGMLAGMVHCG